MQNHLLCKCPTLSLLDLLGIYLTTESLSLSVTVTQTHWRAQLASFTSTAVGATEAPGRLSPQRAALPPQHALLLLRVCTARAPREAAAPQTHTAMPVSAKERWALISCHLAVPGEELLVLDPRCRTTSKSQRCWAEHELCRKGLRAPACWPHGSCHSQSWRAEPCMQHPSQSRGSTQIKDSEQIVWPSLLALERKPLIVPGGTFTSGEFTQRSPLSPRPAFEYIPQVHQMRKPF